jgi:AcrR family transcriptional regulator
VASRARATQNDPGAILRPRPDPDFRQERSRRSYQALIDAATTLFSTHNYDAVGTPEIAQKADVSVGTFYRYFDDKHEVYLEVARRTLEAAYRATIEGLTPARFVGLARHETIAETVAVLFEHVLDRPQLSRSFMEMSLRDNEVAELRQAFEQASCQKLSALISAICPRDVVPDPEATAYVIYGCALECSYGIAGYHGAPSIDADRAKKALVSVIDRALFP